MFLGELEQSAHGWQEIAQRELGQVRTELVEMQGRVKAAESIVLDIQEPQQQTWQAELAAMVDKQLE